jgi:hypothetical protein
MLVADKTLVSIKAMGRMCAMSRMSLLEAAMDAFGERFEFGLNHAALG